MDISESDSDYEDAIPNPIFRVAQVGGRKTVIAQWNGTLLHVFDLDLVRVFSVNTASVSFTLRGEGFHVMRAWFDTQLLQRGQISVCTQVDASEPTRTLYNYWDVAG